MDIDPTRDPRWLGGDKEAEEDERQLTAAEIVGQLSQFDELAKAFEGEGWPTLQAQVESWVKNGTEALLLSGIHDPQVDAEIRGRVLGLRHLLGQPKYVETQRRRLNRELQALEARDEGSEH